MTGSCTLLADRPRGNMEAMPKVRDWMYANSWLVNIIVIGLVIMLILG